MRPDVKLEGIRKAAPDHMFLSAHALYSLIQCAATADVASRVKPGGDEEYFVQLITHIAALVAAWGVQIGHGWTDLALQGRNHNPTAPLSLKATWIPIVRAGFIQTES